MKHSEKSTKYEHFNAVYAGSYAAVLRWIRGRVPADLAEELTQQTFMQYWQWLLAAAAFPKSDKSLLLSIARSVCADHYRAIAARAVCVAIPEDFDLPATAMLTYDSAAFPLFFQIGHTEFLICEITHEIQKTHNGEF